MQFQTYTHIQTFNPALTKPATITTVYIQPNRMQFVRSAEVLPVNSCAITGRSYKLYQ